MKSFLLLYIVLSSCFNVVLAFGERGAAERLLIWYAYRAETEVFPNTTPPTPYTVAPGCQGTAKGNRCKVQELLEYIWSPEDGQSEGDRPKLSQNPPKTTTPKGLFGYISGWPNPAPNPKGLTLTGNLDFKRAVPAATDFYDALSKLGSPLNKAKNLLPPAVEGTRKDSLQNPDTQTRINSIVKTGSNAAKLARNLRQKDMEYYRCGKTGLNDSKYLGFMPETKSADLDNDVLEQFKGVLTPYQVLDTETTLLKRKGLSSDKLDEVLLRYQGDDPEHFSALESARISEEDCKCEPA